jgi:hypothetical protein
MKKIVIVALMVLSVAGFAKSKDHRENVKLTASSAAAAYEMAQDAVVEIKGARYNTVLPMLKKCNLRPNQRRDNFFFKRKAWTNSSWVYLNHVTGTYTAIVKVACTIRKKKD